MNKKTINPWEWQDNFGFAQGISIEGAQRTLLCAGQTSINAAGEPLHADDIGAQINQSLDNLEEVLAADGMTLSDVVRLNYYTTDMDAMMGAYPDLVARLNEAGCRPASTLLGVSRLAFPEFLVEIEATAAV
jgi:enamine deaminase RidA (YjgF/YER057c/UK114 family)